MERSSGILLHITSLPSSYGIGDLGPEAFNFVDFLKKSSQRWWQILPLSYTDRGVRYSPYSSPSAFAGNIWLISPDLLVQEGWLMEKHLPGAMNFREEKVNYDEAIALKKEILAFAYNQFISSATEDQHDLFHAFCRSATWLNDFGLFMALKAHFNNRPWNEWPKNARDYKPSALRDLTLQLQEEIMEIQFYQFLFYHQWQRLKEYANRQGIRFFGDMPFYISLDSADVWSSPEYFKLGKDKKPLKVSGVPPDYYSADGQLWGTPVYNWAVLQENGFDWWLQRIEQNLLLYDLLRIDHFRAFSAYWEVPADAKTAKEGQYIPTPGHRLFERLKSRFPNMPFVAEDLGDIDEQVRKLIHDFSLPGMVVLQFAFDQSMPQNSFAPHNHRENMIAYTGTHDNNTAIGWWKKEARKVQQENLQKYSGQEITATNIHRILSRLSFSSVAKTAILPIQDVLGLGAEAIMNIPGSQGGNWEWRLKPGQLTNQEMEYLAEITKTFGRD